jgi:alanine transaminase
VSLYQAVMKLLVSQVDGKRPGVMIPIPQYPLYSATIAEFDMQQVGYYLNEDKNWALDISELERSLKEAKKCCNPRAIVIINPGNPTGKITPLRP